MSQKKAMRQWTRFDWYSATGPNTPIELGLFSDPQNAWSFSGRVLRMLVSVTLTTQTGFNAGGNSFAYLGLIHKPAKMQQDVFALAGTAGSDNADAGWLFTNTWRLPFGHIPDGPIDLNGEQYHLDWPIHGGKGSNLRRDSNLVMVFDWGPGVGQLQIGLTARVLVVED